MDDITRRLPARLKQARLYRGMTLEAVAEALDSSFTTIWRYEAGQRRPSGPTLYTLAELYGKTVEWFFGDSEEDSEQSFIEADRELVMNEASLALRSTGKELSDEAIRSIADFIRFVHEKERRESQSGKLRGYAANAVSRDRRM